MKNKIKILAGMVLLGGMFLVGTNPVSAGCCVSSKECKTGTSQADCSTLGKDYAYMSGSCEEISENGTCPKGCCVGTYDCRYGGSQEDCYAFGGDYNFITRELCSNVGSCSAGTSTGIKDSAGTKNTTTTSTTTTTTTTGTSGTTTATTTGSKIIGCCVNNSDKSKCDDASTKTCPSGSTFQSKKCDDVDSCRVVSNVGPTVTSTATPTTSIIFPNPIPPVTTISQLLGNILNSLRGILVIIAVTFIVLGGIMYMSSGGNETMVTRAKKIWTGALIGLAIALAAPSFLREIQSILSGGWSGSIEDSVNAAPTIREIALRVLNFLMSILGIIAIMAMIIGGGMYLTAYGDQKRIDTAKGIITYAIFGTVVSLSAVIVVRQIGSLIGG